MKEIVHTFLQDLNFCKGKKPLLPKKLKAYLTLHLYKGQPILGNRSLKSSRKVVCKEYLIQ